MRLCLCEEVGQLRARDSVRSDEFAEPQKIFCDAIILCKMHEFLPDFRDARQVLQIPRVVFPEFDNSLRLPLMEDGQPQVFEEEIDSFFHGWRGQEAAGFQGGFGFPEDPGGMDGAPWEPAG